MRDRLVIHNAESAEMKDLPRLSFDEFREQVVWEVGEGARLCALFGMPGAGGRKGICAVLARDGEGTLALCSSDLPDRYPSLTPDCPQAHLFEREILELWGAVPEGHPWPRPVRALRTDDFFRVEGEGVHEVAVGPVHAGIIEPGHFRFQCYGERVMSLEIALGYQHRGVERAMRGGPSLRSVHYMETLAGDTSIGHSLAYAHAVEALSGLRAPPRAQALRGISLELERMANHAGDFGALAGDVGYLPTASYCGRIRGDFLNMQALICGSRFGRGMVKPGGVAFDLDEERAKKLEAMVLTGMDDLENAAQLLWDTPSVLSRFDDAGRISREECLSLGLVGPPARACGVERDVRQDFPVGVFRFFHLPASTWHRGDVFARAFVRWLEVKRSAAFIEEQIRILSPGRIRSAEIAPRPGRIAVSMVEGWRGEICHVAATDESGKFSFYKVIDPSFRNWSGLALALRGGEISDFPLCNKSFNLSYCGFDL